MLSSIMVASMAMEINIHLCKHPFTLLCVMESPPSVVQAHDDRGARMVRVTALDIQVSLCHPTAMFYAATIQIVF